MDSDHHRHHHHHHHHHPPPKKTMDFVDDLLFETSRLIVTVDKDGLHPQPLPSKAAPGYLQKLIDNQGQNNDEDNSNSTPFDSSNSRSFEELQIFRKKLRDEDRLTNIYKLRHNFSSRFDNRAWLHPHGTTNFDYHAIPKRKQALLERFKNRVRKENYKYLGFHPEIQALISLFLKKLLVAQPSDAAEYLAEYFSTRFKGTEDFEETLKEEMKKLSRYHVSKMKAEGKINIRPSTAVSSEAAGEDWIPELDVNFFKKMNIGPLAADFSFDPSCLMSIKKIKEEEEARKKLRKKKKKPHKYCGCKDWKLKKNRTATAETDGGGRTTATFSTMGNVDTLHTSEEEETEEEGEEEVKGEFVGKLGEEEEEEEFTPEQASRIASELVNEFLDPDGGIYVGHHHSLGNLKNIQ